MSTKKECNMYEWQDSRMKKAKEQENDGTLLTEQKSGATIEEMVTQMALSGKLMEIAKIRGGATAKNVEEAMEQATKMPTMITNLDIESAKNKVANMTKKINEKIEEMNYVKKIKEEFKKENPDT